MQRIFDPAVAIAPVVQGPHPQTQTKDRTILWAIIAMFAAVAWATTRPNVICVHNCGNSTIEVGEVRIDIV